MKDLKEKAEELVDEMYSIISCGIEKNPPKENMVSYFLYSGYMEQAKQCALILVNKLIEETGKKYWYDVKHELEKL